MRQLGDDQRAILAELQRDAEESDFPPMTPDEEEAAAEEFRRICQEAADEARREQEDSHREWLEHILTPSDYDDLEDPFAF